MNRGHGVRQNKSDGKNINYVVVERREKIRDRITTLEKITKWKKILGRTLLSIEGVISKYD